MNLFTCTYSFCEIKKKKYCCVSVFSQLSWYIHIYIFVTGGYICCVVPTFFAICVVELHCVLDCMCGVCVGILLEYVLCFVCVCCCVLLWYKTRVYVLWYMRMCVLGQIFVLGRCMSDCECVSICECVCLCSICVSSVCGVKLCGLCVCVCVCMCEWIQGLTTE